MTLAKSSCCNADITNDVIGNKFCVKCYGDPVTPSQPEPPPVLTTINWNAHSNMHQLIGYCESADFILKTSPSTGNGKLLIERSWIESLLNQARKLSESL